MKKAFLFVCSFVFLFSCRKKDDPQPAGGSPSVDTGQGTLRISVVNMVGNDPLVLNTGLYRNQHGDSFQVSTYKYFLSNFRVRSTSGIYTSVPDSYFLIDQSNSGSLSFALPSLAAARYDQISFLIGVDSAHNVSGAQGGTLDPSRTAAGMFWDWNTGYIMAKIEGTSPQAPTGYITFHMGGFKGSTSVLRTVTLDLPQAADVQSGHTPEVHLRSDLARWFGNPNVVDFSQENSVMAEGAPAAKIADNYSTMFSIDRVDN